MFRLFQKFFIFYYRNSTVDCYSVIIVFFVEKNLIQLSEFFYYSNHLHDYLIRIIDILLYPEKTCPSATLSTTNPTWPDVGLNPGRHGVKPTTSLLSYSTAL
jgi:hypothetical protein